MSRQRYVASLAGALIAAFMMVSAFAQPPAGGAAGGRQRGGDRGGADMQGRMEMFQAMGAIQSYWLTLSFDPKIDDQKLTQLRPAFQKAWEVRDKARASMREQGADFTSLTAALKTASADLEKEIKKVLSEEQFNKLKETAAASSGFGRGGAPGGAPAGAPGVAPAGGRTMGVGGGAGGGNTRGGGTHGTGTGTGGATHGTGTGGATHGTGTHGTGSHGTGAPAAGF